MSNKRTNDEMNNALALEEAEELPMPSEETPKE